MALFPVLWRRLAALRRQAMRLIFILRDQRTTWRVRVLAFFALAYALSPVDLVLDLIPLLGVFDDAAVILLVFWLVERFTPPSILVDAGARADLWLNRPKGWLVGMLSALIWVVVGLFLLRALWRWLAGTP